MKNLIVYLCLLAWVTSYLGASTPTMYTNKDVQHFTSLLSQNEALRVVCLARIHGENHDLLKPYRHKIPEVYVQLINEFKDTTQWKYDRKLLKLHIAFSFEKVIGHDFENKGELILTYVKNDFLHNPANEIIFERDFAASEPHLMQMYAKHVQSLLPEHIVDEDLQSSGMYLSAYDAAIEHLLIANTQETDRMAKEFYSDLLSRLQDDNTVAKVKEKTLSMMKRRMPDKDFSFLFEGTEAQPVGAGQPM